MLNIFLVRMKSITLALKFKKIADGDLRNLILVSPHDTRAILPLPAVMQMLDVLIPRAAEEFVSNILPPVPECFIGARPETQCLDIAHGMQFVLEKGLDKKTLIILGDKPACTRTSLPAYGPSQSTLGDRLA